MPFNTMGLADPLVQGILATGYTAPTEIQSQAIPAILAGKDIVGCAQTGTGKTAAFVLPILSKLETEPQKSKNTKIRVLVVTPTRELAVQIEEAVKRYGRFMKLKTIAVYGGTRIELQIKALRRGVDVVVATPGRLLDHVQRKTINLSNVEMLVLDEADRMLDMGFIVDINKIVKAIPEDRQTLLFSATMPDEIKKLTKNIQKSPKMIQIGQQHNPIETITQHIYPVSQTQKMELLLYLIDQQKMNSVLVFSRTKHGADKICNRLNRAKIDAIAIHSDRTQRQRLGALNGFKQGKYQVMVATDIAARGINVQGISHVINYDVPGYAEDYIHRIGRTGRAEATGDAITFVSQGETGDLKKIEKFIERKFKPTMAEDFDYKTRVNLAAVPEKSKRSRPGSSQRRRSKTTSTSRSYAKPKSNTRSYAKSKPKAKFAKNADSKTNTRPKKKFGKKSKPKLNLKKRTDKS